MSTAPPALRRRSSLVQRDLTLMSLTTDKLNRTESGQMFALDDCGPYIRLEVAARTQKLTASEQSTDVDACLQTLDVEIAKIGRNVFKQYCDIRVSPPDEFFFPCASAMILCGEEAVSWNALKKSLQSNSYLIIKEKIRKFRFEDLTKEKYEHVNDFVRRHWEHLNFKKVSSVCESLAPVSEWVKFQLKKYDLNETLKQKEDDRRSRKSMGAHSSLMRRLSSINNFTVSDQLTGLSLEEPSDEKETPSASFPPTVFRHSTMPALGGGSADGAPVGLNRAGSFGGGKIANIGRSVSRSKNRRATVHLAGTGEQRARTGHGSGGRSKKFTSYRRVPETILEDVASTENAASESKPNAAAGTKSVEAATRGSSTKLRNRRRSSNYLSMYI